MQYAVSMTHHTTKHDGSTDISIKMDFVIANSKEEALGKFIIENSFTGLIGCYKVKALSTEN